MPSFNFLLSALAFAAPFASAQVLGHCDPIVNQQPNPIANKFTTQTTGTLNGTIAIVPISQTVARSIIPAQYKILTKQIQAWLPSLGSGTYPAMLQIEQFHDIYTNGKPGAADYIQAQVLFPFVDRLGDGYTAMAYSSQVIVSSAAGAAINSLSALGYNASHGYFASCNAYEYENFTSNLHLPPAKRSIDQAAWINANTNLGNPNIAYRFTPVSSEPYSINYYYNVTNQPTFSNGKNCNSLVRLYNTDVSEAPYSAVRVKGNATALKGFLGNQPKTIWTNCYGMKVDVAFHSAGNVACSSLKGFHVNSA